MPDGYDEIRREYDSNARGRIFENGTDRNYRDRENGYVQQPKEYRTPHGDRRFDKARVDKSGRVHAIEDKSGRVGGRKDEQQFKKDRWLLERGVIDTYRVRTVEGEPMSKEARELLEGLCRDFPGRVTHQVISRSQAERIFALGREREKDARQQELMSKQDVLRRQRAAERLKKVREAAERLRERERKQRERDDRRRRAEERLPKFREAAERLRLREEQRRRDERLRAERDAREQVAREFGGIMQNIKRQDREAKEAREAREARALAELSELSAYTEQVQQAREAADQARLQEATKAEERARLEREAIERERKQRELADEFLRTRLPPDVTDLLFKSRPTPGLERLHREHPSPGSTRGGRSERERMRERERGGRERL
ncbi:hypothetical protein [Nocardia veterana]|uniref:Uncharacterized protein n=1 Tax=Nocardia veterana TaxID=132249 RepID=A0A7X6RI44_9NOCA|nr:hypothetical protein [Nocardia veterana]NKY86812.1 hypothetical protein [Nocardia veterana]